MKVFATNYLEGMSSDTIGKNQDWNWTPAGGDIGKIVASGAKTASVQSTYVDERDNPKDDDMPQEGILVA